MIAVVNYGMGNLRSVSKALEKAGAKVIVSSDIRTICGANAIVLPGVGAFSHAMKNLKELNILQGLYKSIKNGTPFLGICLGLQLLFTESEEGGNSQGLNLIGGKVKRFKDNLKVPHMGWNQIKIKNQNAKGYKMLEGIPDNSCFYFAHSYYVEPEDKNTTLTTTNYGIGFVTMLQKDNICGVQFHPEKSGDLGLRILKNFCFNMPIQ